MAEIPGSEYERGREALKPHLSRHTDGTFVYDYKFRPEDWDGDPKVISDLLASVLVTNGMIQRGGVRAEDVEDC